MKSSMLDEESTPMYAKAPIYLREAMLFPYTYGMEFVRDVLVKRGKQAAFAGVLENPPLDTHQIMEPAAYLDREPQTQLKVVPLEKVLGSDWQREDFSGLGEIDLRVILRQWGGKEIAAKLSPAWRGGYYMALTNKKVAQGRAAPARPGPELHYSRRGQPVCRRLPSRASPSVTSRSSPRRMLPHQWTTEEGEVRLYVDGATVIALESFTPADAAKIHDALVPAVKKPVLDDFTRRGIQLPAPPV